MFEFRFDFDFELDFELKFELDFVLWKCDFEAIKESLWWPPANIDIDVYKESKLKRFWPLFRNIIKREIKHRRPKLMLLCVKLTRAGR